VQSKKIYRIVPADTPAGRQELGEINQIRVRHDEPAFGSVQEVVDAVRAALHIPIVRVGQLSSEDVT
jgi:hypothetical protein